LQVVTEGSAMIRHHALDSWTHEVVSAFPCLSRPQATVLALYSFGAILADRCGLSSVVLMLVRVLGVGYSTHPFQGGFFRRFMSSLAVEIW
jgi:hypothetical protein